MLYWYAKLLSNKYGRVRLVCFALLFLFSCVADNKKKDANGRIDFGAQKTVSEQTLSNIIATLPAQTFTPSLLRAATSCECSNEFLSRWYKSRANAKGALSQFLVPQIRDEIKDNTALRVLNFLGAQTIANFFASDSKLSEEVSKELIKKIEKVTGRNSLSNLGTVKLDLFSDFTTNTNSQNVNLENLFAIWSSTVRYGGMWNQSANPQSKAVHLLALLKAISEMNYAWGLDVDSNGRPIGALSVDPFSPDSGLAAFDPRKSNAAPARTLSGILNVNYRTGQAVQMATDVQETWSRQPSNIVKFKEQALLWLSGAEVFAHLRPEMRANIAGIFSDDLFPNNVHVLGMVILPAVERMLDKGFIDRDLRVFFDEFNIQVPAQQRIPANLESILLMTNAMTIWTQQLKDVSRADLPQSISSMLVGASDKLKPAVQLGILKVLERVQVLQAAGPGTSGRAALLEYPGGPLAPMSRTLEAAYIILNAESSLGSISPLVRERSAALIVHIVDAMQTGVADANAPETVLWLRAALEKMATVQPTSEFTQLLESLRKIMAGA